MDGNQFTGRFTVSEVEERTGVPASSLRQWERRYGFPDPQRSPSGYRYYSDADLAAIIRMRDLVADGVPPSRAAVLVGTQLAPVNDVRSTEALSSELGDALQAYEGERAEQLYREAVSLYPIEVVMLDVIRPALIRIGDLWHAGVISVATEHFASNFLLGRVRALFRLSAGTAPSPRVLVACAPGERHEIGSLIVATLMRRAGFRVVYLGADMPLEDLVGLVRESRFEAILLSVTMSGSAASLLDSRDQLRDLPCQLILGGAAIEAEPELAERLGGVFLGNDARSFIPQLKALLTPGS